MLLTVGICRLARVSRWPDLPGLKAYHNVWERTVDGIGVSGALLIGYLLAFAVHEPLGIELPRSLQQSMKLPHILPIPIYFPLQALGFFIGFFVVRDVRRAAHARIVNEAVVTGPDAAKSSRPATEAAQATAS
jgi:hypothetical protein